MERAYTPKEVDLGWKTDGVSLGLSEKDHGQEVTPFLINLLVIQRKTVETVFFTGIPWLQVPKNSCNGFSPSQTINTSPRELK